MSILIRFIFLCLFLVLAAQTRATPMRVGEFGEVFSISGVTTPFLRDPTVNPGSQVDWELVSIQRLPGATFLPGITFPNGQQWPIDAYKLAGSTTVNSSGEAYPPGAITNAIRRGFSGTLRATVPSLPSPNNKGDINYVGCPTMLDPNHQPTGPIPPSTAVPGQTVRSEMKTLAAYRPDFSVVSGGAGFPLSLAATPGVDVTWQIVSGTGTLASPTSTSSFAQIYPSFSYTVGGQGPTQKVRGTVTGFCASFNPLSIEFTINVAAPPNTPPTVTMESPISGSAANAQGLIVVQARASDVDSGDRVASLRLMARDLRTNAETELRRFAEPTTTAGVYRYSWGTARPGSYRLFAIATDLNGGSTQSAPVQITVNSNGDPAVQIVAPQTNSSTAAGKDMEISIRASDPDIGDRVASLRLIAKNALTNTESELASFSSPSKLPDLYEYTWRNLPEGVYDLIATATDVSGESKTSAPVRVNVKRVSASIRVETPDSARLAKPGVPLSLRVIAEDAKGGVPNQIIDWDISLAPKQAATKAMASSSKAACSQSDTPASGIATTVADGRADLSFTPGCSVEDRVFKFRLREDPAVNGEAVLRGPISQVQAISVPVQLVERAIVAIPGQPTSVKVAAVDASGAPVPRIPLEWKFASDPAAGVIAPVSLTTDDNGVGEALVTLAATTIEARLEACIAENPNVACAPFILKNANEFVAKPAARTISTINVQALTTTRLQLSQITQRFRQQRSENTGFSNDVGVSVAGMRVPTGGSESSGSSGSSGGGSSSGSGSGSTEREIEVDGVKFNRWGVFTIGDIDIARVDEGDGKRTKLSTKGMTVGVDYRLLPSITVGAAVGGLRGNAELSSAGSQAARGVSGSLFGQWFAPNHFYVNLIGNQGRNSYDLSRIAFDKKRIESNANSTQTGFQLETGYSYNRDRFGVSPYLRFEQVRVKLDPITESDHPDAISISASSLRANTIAFGLVADARIATASSVFIPGLRVEYLSEKQKQGDTFARLINGTPVVVTVPTPSYESRYGTIGLSLQWLYGVMGKPISVFVGIDSPFGKTGFDSKRYTLGVKVPI
jgi:hypothetical protein